MDKVDEGAVYKMTDLETNCPKCDMKLSRYIHSVDHFGMGDYIPNGKYKMKCKPSGYMNTDKKPEDYCGYEFNVQVKIKTVVEILDQKYPKCKICNEHHNPMALHWTDRIAKIHMEKSQ